MGFSQFLFLVRLLSMEKVLDLPHEEKIYNACKQYLLMNNGRVKDFFRGYVVFSDNESLDLEQVLDYIWRF